MSEEKKIKIKYWILCDLVIIVDVIACIVIKDVSCCLSILLSAPTLRKYEDYNDAEQYTKGWNDAMHYIFNSEEEKRKKVEMESNACKGCHYNDGEVHAECVVSCKAEIESEK